MQRILISRGLGIAEIPGISRDLADRLIGELDAQTVGVGAELRFHRDTDADLLRCLITVTIRIADGQLDGVGTC